MDFMDVMKLAVSILIPLLGALFVMLRWGIGIFQSSVSNQQEQVVNQVTQMLDSVGRELESLASDMRGRDERTQKRLDELTKDLSDFKTQVANTYVKSEQWLHDIRNVERKIDTLRADMHDEFKELHQLPLSQPRS